MHLVELDNGTMSGSRIREKFRKYEAWAESDEAREYLQKLYGNFGVRSPQSGFRLLVIAHDKLHAGGDENRLTELFQLP